MAEPLRVAVVGSGAAGCACAWGLLARSEIAEEMLGRTISVDVFDGSAIPGGRVAATTVPELPGLAVNTGASMFHVVGGRDFFGFSLGAGDESSQGGRKPPRKFKRPPPRR